MKILQKRIAIWSNFLNKEETNKPLQGNFLKGTLTLGSFTALTQIISFLTSIFTTRIYSPQDFGIQAIFASILGQLAVITSLRYDWAILLPKRKDTAVNLLIICFGSSICVSAITLTFLIAWKKRLMQLDNLRVIEPYLLLLPLALLATGLYQSINYWFLREKKFNEIARTNMLQSLSNSSTQILLGFATPGPIGLLVAIIVTPTVGVIKLLPKILNNCKDEFKKISIKETIKTGTKYHKFPTFSLCSSFINSAGIMVPVLMLSHFYAVSDVGSFALSQRLIALPIGIIGKSVSQVFLSYVTSLISENPLKIRRQYLILTGFLLCVAVTTSLPLWFSPIIFPVFFGENWHESGIIIKCMIPFFISSFTVSPLSILDWLNRQNWMFAWNIIRFLAVCASFYIAGSRESSLFFTTLIFSFTTSFLYIGLLGLNLIALSSLCRLKQAGSNH